MNELAEWDSFYLIVGGAAGALIGLQFVVMTLIAERPRMASSEAGAAFATPNIVHFSTAFLLSAIMRVPWRSITSVSAVCGLIGLIGIVYVVIVTRRMKTQGTYKPVFEDWLFHSLLPFAAYVMLAVSAFIARSYTQDSLFGVGAASLLLLFIGIHNAWDNTTYNIFEVPKEPADAPAETNDDPNQG